VPGPGREGLYPVRFPVNAPFRSGQGAPLASPASRALVLVTQGLGVAVIRGGGAGTTSGRNLTPAEARVLSVLLGAGEEAEGSRVLLSGLPRSTYVVARRRAYQEGWVYDRFLPHPALGYASVTLALAQPFLESQPTLVERWSRVPGSVFVWSVGATVLGVFFRTPQRPSLDRGRLLGEGLCRAGRLVTCDLTTPSLPVYFDFEGVWAHFAGTGDPQRYPRPLGRLEGEGGKAQFPSLSPGFHRSVAALLARPFQPDQEAWRYRFGLSGLPRSHQGLCRQGWVQWRVFPDLGRLPRYRGHSLARVAFLTGELLPGRSLEEFYWDLTREGGVRPFLLGAEGSRVLVAALGSGAEGPLTPLRTGPSVLSILLRNIRSLESFTEDLRGGRVVKDHRYDEALG
jgi:hypothetical protein